MSALAAPALEIEIGELALAGVAVGSAAHLQAELAAALATGLERRLAEARPPGLGAGLDGFSLPVLDGGEFALAAGASPEVVGDAIAGAVYRSLGGLP